MPNKFCPNLSLPESKALIEKIGLSNFYTEYVIDSSKEPALYGLSVGNKIGVGKVRVILDPKDMKNFQEEEHKI